MTDQLQLRHWQQIKQAQALEYAGTPEGNAALIESRRYGLAADRIDELIAECGRDQRNAAASQRESAMLLDKCDEMAAQVRQQDETITSLRADVERLTKEIDFRQSLLRESNRNCAEHAGVVWTRNVTIDKLKQEARMHAQEARAANATIYEIYQAISGATGEPGNWHGAAPVREYIAQQAERIAELEQEVKDGNRAYESLDEQRNRRGDEIHALKFKLSEQAALIEKCEKALRSAAEWGAPMQDAPKSSRPEWFELVNAALAAIAAMKGGAK